MPPVRSDPHLLHRPILLVDDLLLLVGQTDRAGCRANAKSSGDVLRLKGRRSLDPGGGRPGSAGLRHRHEVSLLRRCSSGAAARAAVQLARRGPLGPRQAGAHAAPGRLPRPVARAALVVRSRGHGLARNRLRGRRLNNHGLIAGLVPRVAQDLEVLPAASQPGSCRHRAGEASAARARRRCASADGLGELAAELGLLDLEALGIFVLVQGEQLPPRGTSAGLSGRRPTAALGVRTPTSGLGFGRGAPLALLWRGTRALGEHGSTLNPSRREGEGPAAAAPAQRWGNVPARAA
mmetsp:Transcript_91275/g.293158  ORF Transcript_91275/g.293158 Transcript_91275/m.293158 type:complete len:293 (-) Transcript_91275:3-881(-)